MNFTTDKISLGYGPTYFDLAERIGPTGRVAEIGVWRGESLAMWQELFPDGLVVGVDISDGCHWPEGTVEVVSSQTEPDLPDRLAHISYGYDLIVDDASHDGPTTRETFDLLWRLVQPGRWYVIEDWQVGFWPGWPDGMLRMAEGLLPLLSQPGGEIADITYRHGQILVRKAPV